MVSSRGDRLVKCNECGGMLPWLSWKAFWSANMRVGNGGPLLQPRGQKGVFYSVPSASSGEKDNDDGPSVAANDDGP